MTASSQGDLFGQNGPDPSGEDFKAPVCRPDLGMVRAKLRQILDEARAAATIPWDVDRLLVCRTIVPHMTHWLPEDEGAQLRFDFETELARLRAA